jgi:hypothetical protein
VPFSLGDTSVFLADNPTGPAKPGLRATSRRGAKARVSRAV